MSEVFLRRTIFFGLGCAFLATICRFTVVDLDLFHEMSLFRETIKTGELSHNDVFSYIPTKSPVVHHEWGTGAILYLVTVQFGFGSNGLMILKYLLSAFVAIGCYIFAIRQSSSCYIFSFLSLFGISLGCIGFTTIRAQLFSLLFLVFFIFLIEEDRKNKRWALLAWLPIHIIWLNIHGGFLVGLGLFAIYIFERLWKEYLTEKNCLNAIKKSKLQLIVLIAACFLVVANPYGMEYLPYIWNAIALDRSSYISEWRPTWEVSNTALLLLILSLSLVIYATTQKKIRDMPGLLILAATAWFALQHYRHLSLYAVVWICYSPAYIENTKLGDLIEKTYRHNQKKLAIFFIIIGTLGIIFAVQKEFWQLRIPTTAEERNEGVPIYPAGVVKYLKDNNFSGNIMVPFDAGAYVSWNLYPNVKVSMDSRFEVAYSIKSVTDNINFYSANEGWQDTLARYSTDAILVPRWSKVEKILRQNTTQKSPDSSTIWIPVYIDDGYSLYMRSYFEHEYPIEDMSGTRIIGTFP